MTWRGGRADGHDLAMITRPQLNFVPDEELWGDSTYPFASLFTPPALLVSTSALPMVTITVPTPPDSPSDYSSAKAALPIDPDLATQMNDEFDLQNELIELSRAHNANREVIEEKLYHLHDVMAKAGRGGKFSAWVRTNLGWGERGYDKAMRWIAAYELRNNLITKQGYAKRLGNAKANTTSRGDSGRKPKVKPDPPSLKQDTTEEEEEVDAEDLKPPLFTDEEIRADQKNVENRERSFITAVIRRNVFTVGKRYWIESAMRQQGRRYGTKTFEETLFKLALCGRKPAAEDDWFGREIDTILEEVGLNPHLATRSEPGEPEGDAGIDDEQDELYRRDMLLDLSGGFDEEELSQASMLED